MPAYNAEQTLRQTYAEIPFDIVEHVVLVDDASSDHTSDVARELGIRYVIKHKKTKATEAIRRLVTTKHSRSVPILW